MSYSILKEGNTSPQINMMELTFITMHDLSTECMIRYASDSILDVLGYQPQDVVNKSTFDFFHSDDLPFARSRYRNEVELNYASSLAYVRVRNKDEQWIGCECVFSCVYDVLIAATTIYKPGPRSDGRAIAAPIVQNAFMASRETARYEMLAHLSAKFSSIAPNKGREPRAAFILNRFTNQHTILYATHALKDVTGVDPADVVGRSFLSCMDADCVEGAIDAFDRAKENDSVAYMRFRWSTPRSSSQTPLLENNDRHEPSPTTSHDSREALDVEVVVSCTSDGIIVVLRSASPDRAASPSRGSFAVPWSTVPLYTGSRSEDERGRSQDCTDAELTIDPEILTSIQEISVFVWGLQHNKDVVQQHARGTPGRYATPQMADSLETSASAVSINNEQGESSSSATIVEPGSSAPNAIDLTAD